MHKKRLAEDFYRQANRIVLDGLRRKLVTFPPVISERQENKIRKTTGVCCKCGQSFTKNVSIQKYCRECGELQSKERYLKRKNDRIKRKNSTVI
jgi:predicted amidophosphoribosyltransferase